MIALAKYKLRQNLEQVKLILSEIGLNLYNQIKIVLTSANQPGKKYKLNPKTLKINFEKVAKMHYSRKMITTMYEIMMLGMLVYHGSMNHRL